MLETIDSIITLLMEENKERLRRLIYIKSIEGYDISDSIYTKTPFAKTRDYKKIFPLIGDYTLTLTTPSGDKIFQIFDVSDYSLEEYYLLWDTERFLATVALIDFATNEFKIFDLIYDYERETVYPGAVGVTEVNFTEEELGTFIGKNAVIWDRFNNVVKIRTLATDYTGLFKDYEIETTETGAKYVVLKLAQYNFHINALDVLIHEIDDSEILDKILNTLGRTAKLKDIISKYV